MATKIPSVNDYRKFLALIKKQEITEIQKRQKSDLIELINRDATLKNGFNEWFNSDIEVVEDVIETVEPPPVVEVPTVKPCNECGRGSVSKPRAKRVAKPLPKNMQKAVCIKVG